MNRQEQIAELKAQIAELEEAERAEKEAETKRRAKERTDDLMAIKESIKTFNEKYDTNYTLVETESSFQSFYKLLT